MIDDNYNSFLSSCIKRADGDQKLADYLIDCPYFEYYQRIVQYNDFVKWKNAQLKGNNGNDGTIPEASKV